MASTNRPVCLLPDGDCEKLTKLLQSCQDTACMIDKLESLGLDVSSFRNVNDAHAQFAQGAKAQFFPHKP